VEESNVVAARIRNLSAADDKDRSGALGLLKRTTTSLQKGKGKLATEGEGSAKKEVKSPKASQEQNYAPPVPQESYFGQEALSDHLAKTELKYWQRTDKYTMSSLDR
jgi:hypothetical protein